MDIRNKTIVVTGGGSGLGRALVLEALAMGAHVIALDINEEALQETRFLAKSKVEQLRIHRLDITKKADVLAIAKTLEEQEVDILINNAGIIQPFQSVTNLPYEKIEQLMNVNFYGCLYMTKAFIPLLKKRTSSYLVNISSMGGFMPFPGQAIYGSAKAAVKLLTEALYSELKSTSVRVALVFPGAIRTNIKINSGIHLSAADSLKDEQRAAKILAPEAAAKTILLGIQKNHYRILLGKDAKFLDLWYRLSPKSATDFIYNKMKGKFI